MDSTLEARSEGAGIAAVAELAGDSKEARLGIMPFEVASFECSSAGCVP